MDLRRIDVRRVIGYVQIAFILCATAACSFLNPNNMDFSPRSESIFGNNQPGVCKMNISDSEAENEVNDAVANDPEAQKLQDILTQLGLSLDVNNASGCMVDEEAISDEDGVAISAASTRTNILGQQVEPEIIYTTTPAGTNGLLHMVEGVNEENNLWLSWQQDSTNSNRTMITHIELFGDNSALDAALAQNMALGVRFTSLEDYNKRRLIHELAQYTTLGAQYAPTAQSSNGLREIEALQFGGQLLDVKNAEAVIVNQKVDPNNSSQMIGEALIVLPLVSNSRGSGNINFELDDALYLRIPVVATSAEPLWTVAFAGSNLPDPHQNPGSTTQVEKLSPDEYGFAVKSISDGAGGWRTGRFRIQVYGHPDWTTAHSFRIVLGARTAGGSTIGFNDIQMVGSSGDSTSSIFQPTSSVPYMTGTVTNGYVWYDAYVTSPASVIFEFKLDIDGDGTEETYQEVPSYFKETSGTFYKVTPKTGGNAEKFALRKVAGGNFMPLTGIEACASDRTNCVNEAIYDHTIDEFNTTIYDPNILDYWSTPLVVPQDFSLTTETLGDVTRDNFYRNYTTERVDVLDIRAFSRWGYDFGQATNYCPYSFYDELAPFKRVFCESYFEIWYQKQWEKENLMIDTAITVHNTNVQAGIYDALIASDSNRDLDLIFAGLREEISRESFEGLLSDVETIANNTAAQTIMAQQTPPGINGDELSALLDCYHIAVPDSGTGPEPEVQDPTTVAFIRIFNELIEAFLEDSDFDDPNSAFNRVYDTNLENPAFNDYTTCMGGLFGTEDPEQIKRYIWFLVQVTAARGPIPEGLSVEAQFRFESLRVRLLLFFAPLELGFAIGSGLIEGAAFGIALGILDYIGSVLGVDTPTSLSHSFIDQAYDVTNLLIDKVSEGTDLTATYSDIDAFVTAIDEIFSTLTTEAMANVYQEGLPIFGTESDSNCLLPGADQEYICQIVLIYTRLFEMRGFFGWMSLQDHQDGRAQGDRLEEGIGTVMSISNGMSEGWEFWGLKHETNFEFYDDSRADTSVDTEWWAAGLRIPDSINTSGNRSLFLFARGDNCAGAACQLKTQEVISWISRAIQEWETNKCANIIDFWIFDIDNECAEKGVATVAFTNRGNASEQTSVEQLADDIAQAYNNSGSSIPIIVAWYGDEFFVEYRCTPPEQCNDLTRNEIDIIACGLLGEPRGCTFNRLSGIGGGNLATIDPVIVTPPPSPEVLCKEMFDDCEDVDFFTL